MKIDNDSLLLLHDSGSLSDEESLLLYEMKKSNVNIFWVKRQKFQSHLFGTKVDGIQSLCIFLKRFSYPCRYSNMISRFGRLVPELCLICNHDMNFVYDIWGHLLKTKNQQWFALVNLQLFIDTIHESGSPFDNCWVFTDGAVRSICWSRKDQRIMYNSYKKVHVIKFQSVVDPNGLIANLYGLVESRRLDSGMLGESGLFRGLQKGTEIATKSRCKNVYRVRVNAEC